MRPKHYLILMAFASATSWLAWGLILAWVDPFAKQTMGFVLFYCSLFSALFGTIALILFRLERKSVPIALGVSLILVAGIFYLSL